MDVDRIREALRVWDSWRKMVTRRFPKAYDDGSLAVQATLAEAARLVVEAPERDWCEVHFCVGQEDWCWAGIAGAAPRAPCRMVPARLLVPPKESE